LATRSTRERCCTYQQHDSGSNRPQAAFGSSIRPRRRSSASGSGLRPRNAM
jgi:hypothetical protein